MFTGYEQLNNYERKIMRVMLSPDYLTYNDAQILHYAKCWHTNIYSDRVNIWYEWKNIIYKLERIIKENVK
jgi:hypothetical protein